MEKLLFVCYMDLNDKGTVGIKKKILSQINTLKQQLGYEVDYIWREGHKIVSNIECLNNKQCFNADSVNDMILDIGDVEYCCSYIRFNRFSFKFLSVLKHLKKSNCKNIIEIPTYPFFREDMHELYRNFKSCKVINSIKVLIKLINNALLPYFSKKLMDRISTYSNDDYIWGIKTLHISNGVYINEFNLTKNNKANNTINLICVSSCLKWHGYDRILQGISNYYNHNKKPSINVNLIIVGEGPETIFYKRFVENKGLSEYVFFKGIVTGEDLDELYYDSDIAIDAMGRHRVGVYYNSSLKGKEYAERGLPIISGVKTEFDLDSQYPFYFRVPADDSAVQINEIIDFFDKIKLIDNYRIQIHEYAKNNFSYEVAMKKIIDYILEQER